ncbi:hypothetical protein C8R44DRAFT_744679 [Mycena epipterygia]|nr:hypothetical protein C8R44DRAFT_744679 [Mycena epipterygia]
MCHHRFFASLSPVVSAGSMFLGRKAATSRRTSLHARFRAYRWYPSPPPPTLFLAERCTTLDNNRVFKTKFNFYCETHGMYHQTIPCVSLQYQSYFGGNWQVSLIEPGPKWEKYAYAENAKVAERSRIRSQGRSDLPADPRRRDGQGWKNPNGSRGKFRVPEAG